MPIFTDMTLSLLELLVLVCNFRNVHSYRVRSVKVYELLTCIFSESVTIDLFLKFTLVPHTIRHSVLLTNRTFYSPVQSEMAILDYIKN